MTTPPPPLPLPLRLPLPEDVELLGRLGDIARELDPAPLLSYELGRTLLSFRCVDHELAELVADTARDLMLTRSAVAEIRLLSFESSDLALEIQLSERHILGQLIGDHASGAAVTLETPGRTTAAVAADANGRFRLELAEQSLLRLVVQPPGGARVVTEWLKR